MALLLFKNLVEGGVAAALPNELTQEQVDAIAGRVCARFNGWASSPEYKPKPELTPELRALGDQIAQGLNSSTTNSLVGLAATVATLHAMQHWFEKDYDGAERIVRDLLSIDDRVAEAYRIRGITECTRRHYVAAKADLCKALSLQSTLVFAREPLEAVCRMLGEPVPEVAGPDITEAMTQAWLTFQRFLHDLSQALTTLQPDDPEAFKNALWFEGKADSVPRLINDVILAGDDVIAGQVLELVHVGVAAAFGICTYTSGPEPSFQLSIARAAELSDALHQWQRYVFVASVASPALLDETILGKIDKLMFDCGELLSNNRGS
jgi:hypothetical protein